MRKISIPEMKRIQVDILKDVHHFCEENGLHYTLAFGSMLGAIRHKGYIPWDDDIDIALLRPDYEKFVKPTPPKTANTIFTIIVKIPTTTTPTPKLPIQGQSWTKTYP